MHPKNFIFILEIFLHQSRRLGMLGRSALQFLLLVLPNFPQKMCIKAVSQAFGWRGPSLEK
jgi:hypothetical protein